MRVFVTGSEGFIGKQLLRHLEGRGHQVFQSDYRLGHDVRNLPVPEGTDIVIHLAAVLKTSSDRILNYLYRVNVEGTLRMLEMSMAAHVSRFVFMSSAGIYECLTPYAASKLAAEAYCRAFSHQIQTKIIRLFNAYGPGQRTRSGALVPNVLDALFNEVPIHIYGDGEQTRDFVYVHDVANALVREIEDFYIPTGSPHDLGTGIATSVNNVVELLCKYYQEFTGKTPASAITYHPLDGLRQPSYSKASMEFKYLPSYTPLETGLRETTEFWQRFVHSDRDTAAFVNA